MMLDDVSNHTGITFPPIERTKSIIASTISVEFTLGDQESDWFEFLRCCLHDKLVKIKSLLENV